MIRFACPRCCAAYCVPDRAAGKKTTCPGCGQKFRVPAPGWAQAMLATLPREPETAEETPVMCRPEVPAGADDRPPVDELDAGRPRWRRPALACAALLAAGALGAVVLAVALSAGGGGPAGP